MKAWMITWVDEDFGFRYNYFLNKDNAIKEGEKVLSILCRLEEFSWMDLSVALLQWNQDNFVADVIWLEPIPFADGIEGEL